MPSEFFLEIFLGILGFGLSILFCTTFCRACSRFREEQIERELWRRNEQEAHRNPIFFIPFPRNGSESESQYRVPRYSEEVQSPPRYSTAAYCGPPPSYNELGIKPEDLPPAYTEFSAPGYPSTPPPPPPPPPPPSPPPLPHTDMVQPQTRSQQ
ncbi:extensin [Acanthopagrus latus]|uniref:extensin n=1 Tax=Acanthopagrus latus TaxID=8177 RepID=UPI00187CB575|nr:extensin [Acanthopagrus latus]